MAALANIVPKFQAKPPFSVEVPGKAARQKPKPPDRTTLADFGTDQKPIEGETPIRRIQAAIPDLISRPEPNISTTYELVRESVKKYGNAKAIGSRKLVTTHQETKKVKKIVDGEEREVDKSCVHYISGVAEPKSSF